MALLLSPLECAMKKRILFVASSPGGHFDRAMALVPAFRECDIFLATYNNGFLPNLSQLGIQRTFRLAYFSDYLDIKKMIINCLGMGCIYKTESSMSRKIDARHDSSLLILLNANRAKRRALMIIKFKSCMLGQKAGLLISGRTTQALPKVPLRPQK